MNFLVLPTFNEAARLHFYLAEIVEYSKLVRDPLTIVVADDGSNEDQYLRMQRDAEEAQSKCKNTQVAIRYFRSISNRGKGAVIREQFLRWIELPDVGCIGFADSDGATPFYEIMRLFDIVRGDEAIDGAIGTRFKCLGKKVVRSYKRFLTGRIFATILSNMFNIDVYDTQCGAKVFRQSFYQDATLRNLCDDNRWLFDTQLVIIGHKLGYRLVEIPVDWEDKAGSKINIVNDSIRMFFGLWRFFRKIKRFGKIQI